MGSSSGSQQQQTQAQSQSAPWQPTQPQLQSILSSLSQVNPSVTPTETSAINQIQNNAQGLPNYGGTATGLVNNLTSNLPNFNQAAQGNLQSLQSTLAPYTNSNFLNPTTNPQIQNALQYVQQQAQNSVNSQFAGGGRSMSPANSQALGYGVASAEAPLLLNQYNQNAQLQQNAANSLYNAGNTTNSSILGNATTGLNTAGAIPGLTNMPALSSLAASNLGYSLPLSQLGGIEGLTLPIAGLGGQTSSSGQSNTNTQYNPSTLSLLSSLFGGGNNSSFNGILGAAQGGANALAGIFG